jgi:hypothetical protein
MSDIQVNESAGLSDYLLMHLYLMNVDVNVGQAGLGAAWVRLCESMGMPKQNFREMCQGMIGHYEERVASS